MHDRLVICKIGSLAVKFNAPYCCRQPLPPKLIIDAESFAEEETPLSRYLETARLRKVIDWMEDAESPGRTSIV
jgi:hypothetical protein